MADEAEVDRQAEGQPTEEDQRAMAEAGGIDVRDLPFGAAEVSMHIRLRDEARREALETAAARLDARATSEDVSRERAEADIRYSDAYRHDAAAIALRAEAANIRALASEPEQPFVPQPITPPAVPPVEIIEEYVKSKGWSDAQFFFNTSIVLNDFRNGLLRVGPEVADTLARVLGRTPEFWLNIQRSYDASVGDSIACWTERIHTLAASKGWWSSVDQSQRNAEVLSAIIAMMHVKLSQQLEGVRLGDEAVSPPKFNMMSIIGLVDRLTEEQVTTLAKLALIHSEISEAVEAVVEGKEAMYFNGEKPEGAVVELVDAMIRSHDLAGHKEWDIEAVMRAKHAYNVTRPYRHGGKKA